MNLPGWNSLQVAEAVHWFLARWALLFLAAVVICNVVMHLIERFRDSEWSAGWEERRVTLNFRGHLWRVIWPGFRSKLSPYRLLSVLALGGFGVAILLEIAAYPYTKRIDALSSRELRHWEGQTVASLQRSATALRQASVADEHASKNKREASILAKETEHERYERVKLEAAVAWRRISAPVQIRAAKRLSSYSGEVVNVSYEIGPESFAFAEDIISVLKKAKWNVHGPRAWVILPVPGRPFPQGVEVTSTARDFSVRAAGAVRTELVRLGFDARWGSPRIDKRGFKDNVMWVTVYARPTGPQGEAKLREEKHRKTSRRQ